MSAIIPNRTRRAESPAAPTDPSPTQAADASEARRTNSRREVPGAEEVTDGFIVFRERFQRTAVCRVRGEGHQLNSRFARFSIAIRANPI